MALPARRPSSVHLAGWLLAIWSWPAAALAQTLDDPALDIEPVISGLNTPTTMAFLAPGDFLVLEKDTGNVRRVRDGAFVAPDPLLTLPVENASERGALGIAIAPGSTPRVFIYYTRDADNNGTPEANRITRFDWNGSALVNELVLRDLPALPGANHDGGVLALDAAGRLYALIGDLNRSGHLQNRVAEEDADDTSVILRLNQDGTAAAGNPLTPYCDNSVTNPPATCSSSAQCGGGTCLTAVASYFAYGVRNGFGLTVDEETGIVWDTENGPGDYDEVNLVPPGFNSGWLDFMGPKNNDGDPQNDPRVGEDGTLFNIPGTVFASPEIAGTTYSDPEFSWLDTNAPTGIVVTNSCVLGAPYGQSVLVGDSNRGQIYRFPLDGTRTGFDFSAHPALQDRVAANNSEADLVRLGSGFAGITDLEMGPDGNLYVVSIGAGTVYRIFRPATPQAKDYFTVTPCRVVDTRAGAPLAGGVITPFTVAGLCGVPVTADAVALNATVTQASAAGNLTLFPGNCSLPATSTVNFATGQTRANNAVVGLATDGDGDLRARLSAGSAHLVLDVVGYFD